MKKYILVLSLFVALFPVGVFSTELDQSDIGLVQDIRALKQTYLSIQKEISQKEDLIDAEQNNEKRIRLQKEVDKLSDKLAIVEDALDNTAADADVFTEEEEAVVEKTLSQEVEDVLSPVVQSFKRMSERPRRIEKLRTALAKLDEKIKQVDEGVSNIDYLIAGSQAQDIKDVLESSKKRVLGLKTDLDSEKRLFQKRLDEELKNRKSFWQEGGDLVRDFFSDKGKNLIISFLVAIAIFAALLLVKVKVLKPILRIERLVTVSKPIMALYAVFAGIFSVISALLCLFLLNDWFLFTIALILIGAILWAFKHLVVGFLGAVRVILDMGTVREGQRIMFEGCPWLVRKVGIRTHLHNDALEGGNLHVSINRIKDLVSRPVVKGEPWFPTKKNDYVLFSDGTYGEVITQTPEQVVLMIDNISRKFFSVSDFLSSRPVNLSDGFVITVIAGIDYENQKKITDVVDTFRKDLKERLPKHTMSVELKEASSDALLISIRVSYDGTEASRYLELNRALNTHVVEICNKHKFNIPFKQLTVHLEK